MRRTVRAAWVVLLLFAPQGFAQEALDLRKKVEWDSECRQAKAYIRQRAPLYTAEEVDKMGCEIAKSIAQLYGWKTQATLQHERVEAARKAERERQRAEQQAQRDRQQAARAAEQDAFWREFREKQQRQWDQLTTGVWPPPPNWDNGLGFDPAPGESPSLSPPLGPGTYAPTPAEIAAVENALAQTRAAAEQARAMGKHDQAAILDQAARQIEQQLRTLKAQAPLRQPGESIPRYEPYADPDGPPAGAPDSTPSPNLPGQPTEPQPRTNTELLNEILGPLASPDFSQRSDGERQGTDAVDDILGGVTNGGDSGAASSNNGRLIDKVLGGGEERADTSGISTARPVDKILGDLSGSTGSGFNRFDETPSTGSSPSDFGRFDNVDTGSVQASEQPTVKPATASGTELPDTVPAMAPHPAPGADAVEHRFTSRKNVEATAEHYGLPNPFHHEKTAAEIALAVFQAAGYTTAAGLNVVNASRGSPVVTEFNPETGRLESSLDAESLAESVAETAGVQAPGIWEAVTTKGTQLQEVAGLIEGILNSINSETPVETTGRIMKLLALGQTLDNHAASLERSIAAAQQQGQSDEAARLQAQHDHLIKQVLPNVRSELNHETQNVQEFVQQKMGIQPAFWRR